MQVVRASTDMVSNGSVDWPGEGVFDGLFTRP
jgi:hypothetical protein